MTGGWKRKENQKLVSLPFPPALEIAGAIPTFRPPQRLFSFTKKEAQTKAPLPTFRSGSFFDENMLGTGASGDKTGPIDSRSRSQ